MSDARDSLLSARDCIAWSAVQDDLGAYARHFVSIDQSIATKQICPGCGGGMTYQGRLRPSSYRAFAVCESCDIALEF